ncbi:hypothetical protein NL676_017757 [Syzygium grande]|nr:hypothetical protein NL676_017757 [Syzygium grande]
MRCHGSKGATRETLASRRRIVTPEFRPRRSGSDSVHTAWSLPGRDRPDDEAEREFSPRAIIKNERKEYIEKGQQEATLQ